MHYANIFIQPKCKVPLDDFASQFFSMLGISNSARHLDRDGEPYFEGSAAGIEFSLSSGSPLPDYSFWVSFGLEDSAQSAEYLMEHAKILAWRFVRADWRCFIPNGEARRVTSETEGVVYAG